MQTLVELWRQSHWADIAAPVLFLLAWAGYAALVDHPERVRNSLALRMYEYRLAWMREMLRRDNRILDIQIIQLFTQNISFFASGAVLIVGGFVAVLGAGEQAREVLADFPFAARASPLLWDLKVLLLTVIFVYAFFKFTWALRQYNDLAVIMGSAPFGVQGSPLPARAAAVASRAAGHFNRGMRAYYFGLAALSWLLHPYFFILATLWVLLVVYRREFRSRMLEVLGPVGEPIPPGRESAPAPTQPSGSVSADRSRA